MAAWDEERRGRAELARLQRERLARLLREVLPSNRFYQEKFRQARVGPGVELHELPFTTKAELLADQAQHPPYGRILTYPAERYVRLHQTSGTRGVPLRWLDTAESWDWMLGCWAQVYRRVGVTAADRCLFPFSFGPFLGFWTAFEAATRMGALCLAGGGLSSGARLRLLVDNQATVVFCTPSYALHLAEAAREQGIPLDSVRCLIVAGEPGGGIPATRARMESAWQSRVFDHSGMTETGPMTFECPEHPGGLHILEEDYIPEVIDPASGQPVTDGQLGELVITNLGRWGSPLIRYRTGDLVRLDPQTCPCGSSFVRIAGGILGRTDEMVPIRGNNFYPSALEGVIRRFAEVVEYRVEVDSSSPLAELRVEIETTPDSGDSIAGRIATTIRDELFFRADVVKVSAGTLPRFEMKAQRVKRK
jgi:phenylacetate-CoA ligase